MHYNHYTEQKEREADERAAKELELIESRKRASELNDKLEGEEC